MIEATEEMKAMARRVAKGLGTDLPFHLREWAEKAALAAIIETTEAARNLALEWRDENKASVADGDTSPAAYQIRGASIEMNAFANALKRSEHIRTGKQYGKE